MIVEITDTIHKDLSDIMRKELEDVGFDTTNVEDKDIPFKYFTVSMRLIEKKPRTIYKTRDFYCPLELQNGLALFKQKVTKGESLFPHQSKSISNLSTEDALLYTWSIQHFHLGETIEADGSIKRTGPVLFAYVTDNEFYEIDIKQHGAWSDKDLLQKLYDNWPEFLESWKIDGQPEVNFNSSEIGCLRKAHINTIVQLNDGTSYIGPGFGMTTAGTPAEATLKMTDINRHINDFFRELKKNPITFLKVKYSDEIISKMTSVKFDFYLRKKDDNLIVAIDKIHGIWHVLFNQQIFLKDKI